MILILSFKDFEQGTNPVIDWLLCKKANFTKITIDDLKDSAFQYCLEVNSNKIKLNNQVIDLSEIKVVWLRRWVSKNVFAVEAENRNDVQAMKESINEIKRLSDYLFDILSDKKWLLTNEAAHLSKLKILNQASKSGLHTPLSIVVNNKSDLLEFNQQCPTGLICKPIEHSDYFVNQEATYSAYTKDLKRSDLEGLPDNFFPTFFQEKVDRKYEIRVFYLDGKFFSSVFLNSDNHHVDIKLDINGKWVPYQLPQEVEAGITRFMKSITMNTGSIDIIRNNAGEYVFIEVNPAGQYLHTSHLCGYEVERHIADWLIENDYD